MNLNKWPADAVERRAVSSLAPYARNARTHSPEQVAQIAASIREFGWTIPVLIDEDGGLIAGHGRVMAAVQLGILEIPVMVARGWSKAQKQAYVLADNQLALNAGWDEDLLRIELAELKADDFDLDLIGFDATSLDDIFGLNEPEPEAESLAVTGSLSARFGVPPFSVLSARDGWWQDRKRAWLALGIQSELGRGANLGGMEGAIERREAIKSDRFIADGGGLTMHSEHTANTDFYRDKAKAGEATASFKNQDKLKAFAAKSKPRKANATPGGSALPAANYSKSKARGNGAGKPLAKA